MIAVVRNALEEYNWTGCNLQDQNLLTGNLHMTIVLEVNMK